MKMGNSESWESALTIVILYGRPKVASRDNKQRVSGISGRVTNTSSNILLIGSQSATNFCIMEDCFTSYPKCEHTFPFSLSQHCDSRQHLLSLLRVLQPRDKDCRMLL
jgi:hypothetical protein